MGEFMFKTLAERLRPRQLADVVGQEALTGKNKSLQLALKQPHSMLFWGGAGTGKTTLARIICQEWGLQWRQLSAPAAGTADFRDIFQQASAGPGLVLFLDEIHRLNKGQQDLFLEPLESGALLLIGATTENPSFEINRALLSRLQIYRLQPLDRRALEKLLERALALEEFQGFKLNGDGRQRLMDYSDGDGRKLLNALEKILQAARSLRRKNLDGEFIAGQLGFAAKHFGKGNDDFYEQISALHKAVRGSHPDAALFWFHSMLAGGTDPHYLARRIVRIAWEDVGLADPSAASLALAAAQTYEQLGSPEGELALAQALLYLAAAPKSNAGYKAFNEAAKFVAERPSPEVPLHLRNATTQLMRTMDYGKGYRYAHDEPYGYAAGAKYMPTGWPEPQFYTPTDRGLEQAIGQRLEFLRGLDNPGGQGSAAKEKD